jgi:dTDP-4-amino-4,6-dideoxygalactose transaminase
MAEKLAIFGGAPVRRRPFSSWPVFGKPEEKALLRALRSGKWGKLHGSEVGTFEQRFAAMHGCKHAIGVVNGTVSLRIGLMAAGIQANDEVIVPAYTFLSTATAVVEANAIPVFVDIDLDSFNLDPKAVEAAITPRTKAIIPVHFAGQPADMKAIMLLARKHKLTVIEDAAHAHGAILGKQPAGSIGQIGSFSFQSSKNLTSGEGGLITSNDDTLAEACRSIHNCGRIPTGIWYEHHVMSGNYRLGEFQGAVLNAQLSRLEAQTRTRDRNGQYLASRLSKLPGLHPQKRPSDCTRHSYHLFMMRIDGAAFGIPRPAVLDALRAEGIPCSGGYAISLNQQPLFRNKTFGPYLPQSRAKLNYAGRHCANSDLICREQGFWLEQSVFLGTRADMDDIVDAFEKVYSQRDSLVVRSRKK